MTTTGATDTAKVTAPNMSWGEVAVRIANHMASDGFSRGDLAALRRMDPESPDAAAFWRLTARYDVLRGAESERRWGLILHGIALMTKTAGDDAIGRSAHVRGMPVGRALFYGGDSSRTTAFYSESRFNRLLTARGSMLRALLARMFRMMAASDQGFDWYQMSQIILSEGDRAERARRTIARDYYWAENRASRAQS